MKPSELRRAALTLYGRRGTIVRLAADLRVDRQTIYRYIRGEVPIPGPVAIAVRYMMRDKRIT